MIGMSNMRLVDKESLTTDVTCIQGVKIKHIVNQLTVTDVEGTDTIIVVAGFDNVEHSILEQQQL